MGQKRLAKRVQLQKLPSKTKYPLSTIMSLVSVPGNCGSVISKNRIAQIEPK